MAKKKPARLVGSIVESPKDGHARLSGPIVPNETESKLDSVSQNPFASPPNRGRPEGAKNINVIAIVELSRCPQCLSTDRGEYTNVNEMEYGGERNGQPFTHIVWRSTKCLSCGQARRDRCYENRVESVG